LLEITETEAVAVALLVSDTHEQYDQIEKKRRKKKIKEYGCV